MTFSIDVSRSIQHRKLLFNRSILNKISGVLVEVVVIFAVVMIAVAFSLNEMENSRRIELVIVVIMIAAILVFGIIYSMIHTTKLKSILGTSETQNKNYVNHIGENQNWIVISQSEDHIMYLITDKWSGFHWGRYLTVMFIKNEILINSFTTDLFGEIIPYHWFINRKKEREFIQMYNTARNIL